MKLPIFILILFSITLNSQCTSDPSTQTSNLNSALADSAESIGKTSKLNYKIIAAPEKTFGYDIYLQDKLLIQQQSIPSIPGNKGFLTKTDAEKVAQLVISKLKQGKMPPTITLEEMKNLNVIK